MKNEHPLLFREEPSSYQVADAVWIFNESKSKSKSDINRAATTIRTNAARKLQNNWLGPFRITQVESPTTYTCANDISTHSNVHYSRLKPFFSRG